MRGSLRPVIVKLLIFTAFTVGVTALLAAVIGNIQPFTDFYTVKATFTDATGLLRSDLVKVAGVNVGKVVGAEVSGPHAVVTLQVRKEVTLPSNVRAAIRYRNLVGVRMVELSRDPLQPDASPLPKNGKGTIPVERTSPAFDLGIVFNNLKPVLSSLNPEDANIVSRAIVKIFAGREIELQRMVANLADLAQTLGEKGPVAADLIRDLNTVVTSLGRRDQELRSILTSFDQVLSTLATRSDELGRAIVNVGDASNGLADLLKANRPALDTSLSQLADILALVRVHKQDLDQLIVNLSGPRGTTHSLNRATTYGEWGNLAIVCLSGEGPTCPKRVSSASAPGGGLRSIFEGATK